MILVILVTRYVVAARQPALVAVEAVGDLGSVRQDGLIQVEVRDLDLRILIVCIVQRVAVAIRLLRIFKPLALYLGVFAEGEKDEHQKQADECWHALVDNPEDKARDLEPGAGVPRCRVELIKHPLKIVK